MACLAAVKDFEDSSKQSRGEDLSGRGVQDVHDIMLVKQAVWRVYQWGHDVRQKAWAFKQGRHDAKQDGTADWGAKRQEIHIHRSKGWREGEGHSTIGKHLPFESSKMKRKPTC